MLSHCGDGVYYVSKIDHLFGFVRGDVPTEAGVLQRVIFFSPLYLRPDLRLIEIFMFEMSSPFQIQDERSQYLPEDD